MRGIDIASWQAGLDPAAVDADFIIIKATEGVSYVNPFWRDWAERTLASGKRLGFYHYANGGDVYAEARFFIETVKDYIGRAVLVLDWEEENNARFWAHNQWTNPWLAYVRKQTGATPLLYLSASIMGVNDTGFPMWLWVAQYANENPTGYQEHPWNEGAYECAIRQYSSKGRIQGYSGNLDLNKAYITPEQWDEYAGKKKIETEVSDMVFSFQPEGDKTAYIYENGTVYALDQLDELKAWRMAHKAATGKELPHINDIDPSWCAKASPYWKRFADSLGHKVTLKGFGK